MCKTHYGRWKKHGDPLLGSLHRPSNGDVRYWGPKDGPKKARVYMPEHHSADKRGYVLRHRLEFEQAFHVTLDDDECVAAKDGNLNNTSIDNLIVISHSKRIVRCSCCGKPFVRWQSQLALANDPVCSKECSSKYRNGKRGPNAVYTPDEILTIRAIVALARQRYDDSHERYEKAPETRLAKAMGTTYFQIHKICDGRSYSYLPVFNGGSFDDFALEIANYRSQTFDQGQR